jgi:Xaa-Pro aminopeptidase
MRPENSRYLTGFALAPGEDAIAGDSGTFFVFADRVVVLADSRYRERALADCPDAEVVDCYQNLAGCWAALVRGCRRVGVEAGFVSHATWSRLAAETPDVELVPIEGWVESDRSVKEASEVERIAAACAIADAALERLLPRIRPGATERELGLELEWTIRTGGAEALAFDVACLAGPHAALPHGLPSDTPIRAGQVLLFDFGAQVAGYRSDMTRTLFVGPPTDDDIAIYHVVRAAQQAALDALEAAVAADSGSGVDLPSGRAVDAIARSVIAEAGFGEAFGHSLGHGIGLATHELPALGQRAPETPLPAPTVFSVEPGIYLPGRTGVRIEDLVLFDPAARRLERLTRFPGGVTVVGEG